MEHMTAEERERFRQRLRERTGFDPTDGTRMDTDTHG
jgi:hypothetical protein